MVVVLGIDYPALRRGTAEPPNAFSFPGPMQAHMQAPITSRFASATWGFSLTGRRRRGLHHPTSSMVASAKATFCPCAVPCDPRLKLLFVASSWHQNLKSDQSSPEEPLYVCCALSCKDSSYPATLNLDDAVPLCFLSYSSPFCDLSHLEMPWWHIGVLLVLSSHVPGSVFTGFNFFTGFDFCQ
jgi:hypothetical protein